jgi:hypothetical protein
MAGQHFLHGNSSAGVWTPEDRDFMEQDELMMDINSSRKSSLDLTFDDTALSNEEKYLRAYWAWVHPFYPVVHQPSFDIHNTSPLLKAAMLALGAQAMDEAVDKKKARLLHERSMKVLQKVPNAIATYVLTSTDTSFSGRLTNGILSAYATCKLSFSSKYTPFTNLDVRLSNSRRSLRKFTSM